MSTGCFRFKCTSVSSIIKFSIITVDLTEIVGQYEGSKRGSNIMTIEEINQALTKTHPKLYAMDSEEGKQLQLGTRVFIGSAYQLHQGLIEASVIKVDARGVVKTSCGINFSTSSRDCTSTQKVTDAIGGASYRSLFLAEEVEKAVEDAIKRDAGHKLKKLHQELLEKVTNLDPTKDQELIAELLTKL